ncbi:protein PHLOEM PROTEIN 2-LIKE A1-like [Macadamia integrifolia]|uniref:protein PHLOEM PROTEIN 2-LIKE A1-like n=1 Tax=Macadamia integrifolia TaxID=60698 RepID=UPI001C4FE284|nr:protein PHLOEM PROTEIN 2-LIKE A1-like [Macadamia integrifolia]
MQFAKDFSIHWGDDSRYWKWVRFQETRDEHVEVAELIEVYWLEVCGKCDTVYLSPGVTYEFAFVVMLKDGANGWAAPVKLELLLPDGKIEDKEVDLGSLSKGQWKELVVGELETFPNMNGDIQFSLLETNGGDLKTGLVIEGIIIRPKLSNYNGKLFATVTASDLTITWDEERYWRWYCLNENDILIEVAELLNVYWLEVNGKFNISKLSPEITYEVIFEVMLKETECKWEDPVNLRLVLPDRKDYPIQRKESLQGQPRGKWIYITVGEFKKDSEICGEMQFSLFETECQKSKKGLVLKNVIIRRKE